MSDDLERAKHQLAELTAKRQHQIEVSKMLVVPITTAIAALFSYWAIDRYQVTLDERAQNLAEVQSYRSSMAESLKIYLSQADPEMRLAAAEFIAQTSTDSNAVIWAQGQADKRTNQLSRLKAEIESKNKALNKRDKEIAEHEARILELSNASKRTKSTAKDISMAEAKLARVYREKAKLQQGLSGAQRELGQPLTRVPTLSSPVAPSECIVELQHQGKWLPPVPPDLCMTQRPAGANTWKSVTMGKYYQCRCKPRA